MRGQLYILGVSHPLQCGSSDSSTAHIDAFEKTLRSICNSYNIRCIAEEMNQEGLSKHKVVGTVAEKLAKLLGVGHHYVDLTSKERAQFSLGESALIKVATHIGFKDGGSAFRSAFDETLNEIRERCWSARILANQKWPTLFICGSNHSQNMYDLWSRFGLSAVVVHKDYKPEPLRSSGPPSASAERQR